MQSVYLDGACGVSVGVVSPALIFSLIPGSQILDDQTHSASVLVVPSLLAAFSVLSKRQALVGPLDGGSRDARDDSDKHGLATLLHSQSFKGLNPLGRSPRDPITIKLD